MILASASIGTDRDGDTQRLLTDVDVMHTRLPLTSTMPTGLTEGQTTQNSIENARFIGFKLV